MDKKERIIKSAVELFGKNGFLATPTSKVARKAEVSNGTLFHYFPTKNKLIDECYQNCQKKEQKHLHVMLSNEEPLKEVVRGIWFYSIMWALENYSDFLFIQKFRHSTYFDSVCERKQVLEIFTNTIERGQTEGVFKKLPNLFMYDLVTSQAISSVNYFKKNPKEISNTDFLNTLFTTVWDSISAKN